MALEEFEFTDSMHGMSQLFDDLINSQVAEVMGRLHTEEPEGDIRRAGSHCQLVLM